MSITVNDATTPNRWFYLSAYAIAVKHGYKGTEEEWVRDLYGGQISAAKSAAKAERSAAEAAAMRSGSISAAAAARDAAGDAEVYAQRARSFIGIPKTAMSAAAMTDTTAIYVYCGDEAGYNFGHWYYHGNGAWNDGGAYFAATQMVTDEYGSVYTSADERTANLREAEETPVYHFSLGDFQSGWWNSSGTPHAGRRNTANHPIRYDPTMWIEILDDSADFYLYFGTVSGGVFSPHQQACFPLGGSAQTISLRAYKRYAEDCGPWIAFSFEAETPPFRLRRKSPVCRLIPADALTLVNSNTARYPVDANASIRFYSDAIDGNYKYADGARYVFAGGLPLDCRFYSYNSANGTYEIIECGFPVGDMGADDTAEDGADADAPGDTVYPRAAKIPEGCSRFEVAVYGIQRPTGRGNLGNVLLELMPEISVWYDAERTPVPSHAVGQAIRNAKQLAGLSYPAGAILTKHYAFQPYPSLELRPAPIGFPYGSASPGINGSFYSYLTAVRPGNGVLANEASGAVKNCYWGYVCTAFISTVLGLPYVQGTEWWLQTYHDRLRRLREDSVLSVGDIVVTTEYYRSIPAEKKQEPPLTAGSAAEMTDTGRVYIYQGTEAGYSPDWWYYWNGSAWVKAPRSLYTHIKLIVDKLQDPGTGEFVGYIVAESTEIWTRLYKTRRITGNNSWYMPLPLTDIHPLNQSYRYEVDRLNDPLSDPKGLTIPPVIPYLGDMTLVHDFVKTEDDPTRSNQWGGCYALPYRWFSFQKGYNCGRLIKDAGEPLYFPLETIGSWHTAPSFCNYGEISALLDGPGDYSLAVGVADGGDWDSVDWDSVDWSAPCSFRWFTAPGFTVREDETGKGARHVTVSSLGSFDEAWVRAIPAQGAVLEGMEELPGGCAPYANYVMLRIPAEAIGSEWDLPEEYSHISSLSFVDNSYGTISRRVAKDYDPAVTYDGNEPEDGAPGGDEEPEE